MTPQWQSQFTLKMKANAVPHLLSSLVWIDRYNKCNEMISFMEFMRREIQILGIYWETNKYQNHMRLRQPVLMSGKKTGMDNRSWWGWLSSPLALLLNWPTPLKNCLLLSPGVDKDKHLSHFRFTMRHMSWLDNNWMSNSRSRPLAARDFGPFPLSYWLET